jgi:hypothetical protein
VGGHGAVCVLLEVGELLAELDHVLQARHQDLPKRHSADRLLALDWVILDRDLQCKHLLEVLSQDVEPAWRAGAGGDKGVVQVGR